MNRRGFLALSGTTALAATLNLAGCGGSGNSGKSGGKDVSYWLWQDDATDPTWQKLADEFNKTHPDIHVTLQVVPLAQYQDKLLTAATSGHGPDAARLKDWWIGQFAPKKALVDLTELRDKWAGRADIDDSLWATGQVPGSPSVYMLPHQYVTLYLYYRKDYFAAAGLSAPKTHQDVLRAAGRLTDPAKKRYGMDVRGGAGGQDQWLAWMYSGGASVVDAGGQVVLDDSTAVGVNQDYLDIEAKLHAAPPGSITAGFDQVKGNFVSGTTAMMIHHPGSRADVRKALGDKVGVVPMPSVDPSKPSTLGSMSGNVVLSSSKKRDAAWAWISWLSEKTQMATLSASPQGQLPVLTSVAAQQPFASDAFLKVALGAMRTAKTWPALPGVAQIAAKDWSSNMQAAFTGKASSADALKALADVLRKKS